MHEDPFMRFNNFAVYFDNDLEAGSLPLLLPRLFSHFSLERQDDFCVPHFGI